MLVSDVGCIAVKGRRGLQVLILVLVDVGLGLLKNGRILGIIMS